MNNLTTHLSALSLSDTSHQSLIQQQKSLHLTNLIEAFDDPSIKKLQEYNKNKVERELLDIATNFYSLVDKLDMILWFCMDYKTTLESYKKEEGKMEGSSRQKGENGHNNEDEDENDLKAFGATTGNTNGKKVQKMVDQSLQSNLPIFLQQQLTTIPTDHRAHRFPQPQLQAQPQINDPQPPINPKPLIILPAKRLQTNKQQIQSVINKLKVMIVKVNTKESSSFQHVYSTYISRLKYTLEHSTLKEKQFKMSVIKIMLTYLRQRYVMLKIESRNIYPFHPTRYPALEMIGFQYADESPMFFVNFFVQQLLFFNNGEVIRLIKNFSELLYCPIILIKGKAQQTLRISPWYYEQLSIIEPLWRSTILVIKIFNIETSLRHPIYYSHISTKKFEFSNELKNQLDRIHQQFPFMEYSHQNQLELLSDLEAIKEYIYQTLMFGHLRKVLDTEPHDLAKNGKNKVHVDVQGGFRVEFELVADLEMKETLKSALNPTKTQLQRKSSINSMFDLPESTNQSYPQPIYKSQFISDLLLFYKRKNLFTLKRATLYQELQILFKASLFKILTEDIEYRTVNPAYSGSLALYYYEKKTIKKNNVKDFLSNFGEK